MAVTAPGEIEWTPDGGSALLIDVYRRSGTSYWTMSTSELNGWHPEPSFDDAQTPVGAAPGREVAQAMYPQIMGLAVATAADLAVLMGAKGKGTLQWWDPALDSIVEVDCLLRRVLPSTAYRAERLSWRTVDVEWFIGRPADIDWDAGSS